MAKRVVSIAFEIRMFVMRSKGYKYEERERASDGRVQRSAQIFS